MMVSTMERSKAGSGVMMAGHIAILGRVVKKPLADEVSLEQKPKEVRRQTICRYLEFFVRGNSIDKFEQQPEAQGQY